MAQSNIRLFGTSSQVLTINPQDNEEDDSSDDEGLIFKDNNDPEYDTRGAENEEEEDITPDGRIPSLLSTTTKECIDIEYAQSHSSLGDDEECILVHDDHNILSDVDMADGESTPRWKLNLSERAQHSPIRKARRKDWIELIYSCSLSPEGSSITKGKVRTGTSRWTVTTTFS